MKQKKDTDGDLDFCGIGSIPFAAGTIPEDGKTYVLLTQTVWFIIYLLYQRSG